jgi:hypothetical protein
LQLPYFYRVRGRVASNFAQNKIIAGKRKEAFHIVKNYGDDMPINMLTHILRNGGSYWPFGWLIACILIKMYEYLKVYRTIILQTRFSYNKDEQI